MAREVLKGIKSENRLSKIRLIMPNDPVIGGQPSDNADEFTSNTPFLDLACTLMYALAEVGRVDKKDIPKILDALGDSRTAGASQRIVNEVNKLAKNAETAANFANDKANQAKQEAYNADQKAVGAQSSADKNAKEIEKKVSILQVKNEFLKNSGSYTSAINDVPILTAGSNGLAQAGAFLKNNPDLNFAGLIPSSTWLYYETQSNYSSENLVVTFKGYNSPILLQATKRAGADWSKPILFINNENIFLDKAGFFKDKDNNINAMIAADLLQKLNDSTTEAVSAKVVNDVNRKAVNAEVIGINADAKAVAAQKKADQVPEPKAKNFVVGMNTTSYELMTPEQVKILLNVPAAAKLYSGTGQATDGSMTQKAVTEMHKTAFSTIQKLTNVTAERVAGSDYTNTDDTFRFISVSDDVSINAATVLKLFIDNQEIQGSSQVYGNGSSSFIVFMIPPLSKYRITSDKPIKAWWEIKK